ncbi:MAG: DUF3078 domain-containing protein [Chitinophagaceae bacterium]
MKSILFSGIVLFLNYTGFCQDTTIKELKESADKKVGKDPADTIPKIWKKGGLYTLSISQGSLTNWQGGGDKSSFSIISFLNLYAFYKKDKNAWDNTLDLGYGFINTTSLGTRKSDDRIDLLSKYGYQISKYWYAGALLNFRTQFTDGFEYSKDKNGAEVKTKTSGLLAPAYILLSLGFNYKPSDNFSLFLSPLSERWIIVNDTYLSLKGAYGVEVGKKSKNELGAFLSAEFNKEIAKNVVYKSRLDAFSNYKSKPQNVDIFWTNVLAMKVNKFLSANIVLDLLYDDDAIGKLQVRELLGVGFSAKF